LEPDERGSRPGGPGIARIVRFVVLLAVLVALIVWIRACGRPKAVEQEGAQAAGTSGALDPNTESAVLAALENLRNALKESDTAAAREAVSYLGELAPEDDRVTRATIPFAVAEYVASGDPRNLEFMGKSFNKLYAKGLGGTVEAQRRRGRDALAPFEEAAEAAASAEMVPADLRFVADCVASWRICAALAEGSSSESETALRLCRWFALHILPDAESAVVTSPLEVLRRGHGTRVQIAWAYAELARQADIRSEAVAIEPEAAGQPPECLVQVHPRSGEPFLVNPARGVAVTDLATGRSLSLADLTLRPGAYRELLGAADIELDLPDAAFRNAVPGTAVYPRALYERVIVLDHLLADLPARPTVGLNFAALPAGEHVRMWPLVIAELRKMRDPQEVRRRQDASLLHSFTDVARDRQLGGLPEAHGEYEQIEAYLRARSAEADVPRAISLMETALERVAFFLAQSLYDAGRKEDAGKRLEAYMEDFPEGRWRPLAAAMQAELLAEQGRTADAARAFANLPEGRKLYGALRARELHALP